MGFLQRLPSFSKRNRNKIAESSPVTTSLDPLKENVKAELHQQPLNVTPLNATVNVKTKSIESKVVPSTTSYGLLDDIFTELNQASLSRDSLQDNISLSFALSQHLQPSSTSNQQQHQAKEASASSANTVTPSTLFGQDSIYSRYASKPEQDNKSQTSPLSSNAGVALPSCTNALSRGDNEKKNELGTTTQTVLDSDVSGSDDDNDEDGDSESEAWGTHQQSPVLDACPITERRRNDHRWNVTQHVDRYGNRMVESNQTMLNRMKDRHRQQVKLQNIRQQQHFSTSGMTIRSTSPMFCVTPPPHSTTAMIAQPLLQRNSPITTLTRSSSLSSSTSTQRNRAKHSPLDHSPLRPSPLSSKPPLRSRPSATTVTTTSSATSFGSTSTANYGNEYESVTTATGTVGDDYDDADDEADNDNTKLQRRPTTNNSNMHVPSLQHAVSVPDLKKKAQNATHSPSLCHALVSDHHSTSSFSSSSSSSSTTATATPHSVTSQVSSPTRTKRHDDYSFPRMRSMASEPDLKQHAPMSHHPHIPMNGYQQLLFNQQQQQQIQQQRQRLQLEWEMMQLYQREQQLKQEYMLLQQQQQKHHYQQSFFSPIHKSCTSPSLSTAHQDPRFYYASSLGPALY
ncbi:hypothetical protein BCR42DRAFT_160641 [Absidia repens]|uniref:Uncharacterized protein n=1 Tax=Absidia repens TaxID=90262 RepID=A0A1X2IT63_9FUNG|nr:hypothetical protein BCR42DRAFT_160641 [Absidia repens]